MAAAVMGLLGALLGGAMTLAGALFVERKQAQRERERWRRDKLQEAYDGTIHHILRVLYVRSAVTAGGFALISRERVEGWFEDLVQAQFHLHTATRFCGDEQGERLERASVQLDEAVREAALRGPDVPREVDDSGPFVPLAQSAPPSRPGLESLEKVLDVVSQCAKQDGLARALPARPAVHGPDGG